jgi:protein-export membrane protein SecD
VALGLGAYYGFSIGGKEIIPGINGIRKGLDVAGGVRLIYTVDGDNITEDGVIKVENILRKRLDDKGLNEATVSRDLLNPEIPMIVVEIPGFDDPQEASRFLGQTAKLQFVESDGETVVIEGTDIVGAQMIFEQTGDALGGRQYQVQLNITNEAVEKFAASTEKMAALASEGKNKIAIVLDGVPISEPQVNERIETNTPVISGSFTKEYASELAGLISSGALPFDLIPENQEYVGPTIGHQALEITVRAGLIALIVIVVLLMIIYRIPGFVSALGLILYAIVFILIYEWAKITLTLPGIAGLILSVAMAVDASIIIYERLREELRSGKTIKTSIDKGFELAFSAVRDSSITTLISACVLYFIGTGTIKGFAISLLIGVILSFFMSIFLLKFVLKNLTTALNLKNRKFFAVKETNK